MRSKSQILKKAIRFLKAQKQQEKRTKLSNNLFLLTIRNPMGAAVSQDQPKWKRNRNLKREKYVYLKILQNTGWIAIHKKERRNLPNIQEMGTIIRIDTRKPHAIIQDPCEEAQYEKKEPKGFIAIGFRSNRRYTPKGAKAVMKKLEKTTGLHQKEHPFSKTKCPPCQNPSRKSESA